MVGGQSEQSIHEPARELPVCADVDIVVVGGSCTGVFAAVRAARLGARVALIELHNQFGGVATARLVNVWHTLWDTHAKRQIIAGLTQETVERLTRRDAVIETGRDNPHGQFTLNSAELACELDEMVREHTTIRPFLHARMTAVVREGDANAADAPISAVIIEDKTGRRAIRCRFVIDASGDADVPRRLGLPTSLEESRQPPTMAGLFSGLTAMRQAVKGFSLNDVLYDRSHPRALRDGFTWDAAVPGAPDLRLVFATRVHGVDCSDGDQLTLAEMEGRRQLRQIVDLLRDAANKNEATRDIPVALAAVPACIGIRETRKAACLHRLTERQVLTGERFDDAIANGSYRVDIHHQGGDGITFRYLDGREVVRYTDGRSAERLWRDDPPWGDEGEATGDEATFYQAPYRCLVPRGGPGNLLIAGRCVDTDIGAFGATRVMVNCNQMGEAAGVAAVLALETQTSSARVDTTKLRATLKAGGSAII